jgi:2-keto-4-pentenoate hydratase/2-oxohepta-3-ene-1,7-dioic acid hydratase in catechol pathway
MGTTRRTFLKTAGVAGVLAVAGLGDPADAAEAAPKANGPSGPMARDLTLCTLRKAGGFGLGVRTSKGVLDVAEAARGRKLVVPASTDEAVRGIGIDGLRKLIAEAEAGKKSALIAEAEVRFGPALTHPEKILLMGLNYRKHIAEVKAPTPTSPTFFSKYLNALNHHGGTVPLPVKVAVKFDYEAELVVVVGKRMRDVATADALAHVWGYCTGNDFTARDLQNKTSQWMLGKTPDGFAPLGPWLVGADRVGDPQNLKIECRVNGQVRQSSNTSDMIYSCAELLAYASQHMTLEAGDILFTGTPEGVINGKPPDQQVWLKPGDKLETEIEKTGRLDFELGVRGA